MFAAFLLIGLTTVDPAGAPVLAPNLLAEQEAREQPALFPAGDARLQEVYAQHERPRVLFLLGEPLTDAISSWHSQSRWHSQHLQQDTAGDTTRSRQRQQQLSRETRQDTHSQRSSLLDPQHWTEFEQGFNQRVQQAGLQRLHWNLALRLLDAERQGTTDQHLTDDPERMSFAVLQQHGDILVEVLPYTHQGFAEEPIAYQIRISSLHDASVLADQRLPLASDPGELQAGSGGYRRQQRGALAGVTAEPGGYQLHYQPTEPWVERGLQTAEGTLQLLYELWHTSGTP